MYTITDYAAMMADVIRIDAYSAALAHAVRPSTIVADLGAGTGIFSLLAARLGAQKIYAIEPDDAIHVARSLAAANALEERIEFIQARSEDVALPGRVSLVVSDMRGTLPLFEGHLPAIRDARERFLTDDGLLIPQRDRLWVALADVPEVYADHVTPWGGHTHGLVMQPLGDMLANTWRKVWLSGHQLLSPHVSLATIDYRSVNRLDVDTDVRCVAARAGTAHGLCVWFDTDLVDGIGFSNAPGEQRAIHGQAFFPFATPVALCEGESFEARIQATLVGDDYMWQWSGGGHMQCTLHGVPLGAKQLMKGAATHVPVLNDEGQIDLFVLSRMQQSIPLGEIARELLARFPSAVRDRNTALGRAGDLARRYAKD